MNVFFDTNVLIAASIETHEHHEQARRVLERARVGDDVGFLAAHSLAECFSVLTRLPMTKRISPQAAARFLRENVIRHFRIISLTAEEYASQIDEWDRRNIVGGKIYDALQIACAEKAGSRVDRVYTFNARHFESLASDSIQRKIRIPS